MNFKNILAKSIGTFINILNFLSPKLATQWAYKFFSEPRLGKHSSRNYPLELQTTNYEMLHYNEHQCSLFCWQGSDNKILLVHGWESNAARWISFLPYLQQLNMTIFALEAPAHGWSSGKEFNVPLYADFIQVVMTQHQPQFIVGHSIGGAACLYHRYLHPNPWVKRMVVLGAPSELNSLILNYQRILGLNSKVILNLEIYFQNRFGFSFKGFSAAHFASNFDIQGVLAHDLKDEVVAFSEGEKIAENWKKAKWIVTNGLGHSMHDHDLYQNIALELKSAL